MKNYRKKPVVIQAVLWDGKFETVQPLFPVENAAEPTEFDKETGELIIKTLEGNMTAKIGDYIIKGIMGEVYPCKSDIFEATYELVEE